VRHDPATPAAFDFERNHYAIAPDGLERIKSVRGIGYQYVLPHGSRLEEKEEK
jgi:hypothetical protein